jgi:hypothetical protein
VDPVQPRGVGSGERASGACGGATAGEDGDGRTPCKLGGLENELAGVRRCYGGRGRRWGRSHARCGWSEGVFSRGGSRSVRSARTI